MFRIKRKTGSRILSLACVQQRSKVARSGHVGNTFCLFSDEHILATLLRHCCLTLKACVLTCKRWASRRESSVGCGYRILSDRRTFKKSLPLCSTSQIAGRNIRRSAQLSVKNCRTARYGRLGKDSISARNLPPGRRGAIRLHCCNLDRCVVPSFRCPKLQNRS